MSYQCFLIAKNSSTQKILAEIVEETGLSLLGSAADGDEARRQLNYHHCDVILMDTPLIDETGDHLARDLIALQKQAGFIILCGEKSLPLFQTRLKDALVFYLPKPVSKQNLTNALSHIQQSLKIIANLREKNSRLEKKLEDFTIINRAKNILMANLHMSESDAHRYLQKQAMDMHLSKREIAQSILNTYEI